MKSCSRAALNVSFCVPNKPFGTQNNPFGTQNKPFGTQNKPFGTQNSLFGTQNGLFCAQNSTFGTQNSLFCAQNSTFCAQNGLFGTQNGLFGTQNGLFGTQNFFPVPSFCAGGGGTSAAGAAAFPAWGGLTLFSGLVCLSVRAPFLHAVIVALLCGNVKSCCGGKAMGGSGRPQASQRGIGAAPLARINVIKGDMQTHGKKRQA
ncbi:MAG: hypothetical protein LBS82_01650 [Spirochaetaceae bacterium]|nr:hypothetical protein [Spirochaetaceae bacterium]